MTLSMFIATLVAGFIYSVIPGPAVLLVFSLAAQHGRAMGAKFLAGHMAGDIVWSAMAFASILGVSQMVPMLFEILGAGCGLYLIYLGIKAMFARTTIILEDGIVPVAGQIIGWKPTSAGMIALNRMRPTVVTIHFFSPSRSTR